MAETDVDKTLSGKTFGVSDTPLMGGDFRLNTLSIISWFKTFSLTLWF